MDTRTLTARLAVATVLVVDDDHYMRKVVRTLLMTIGVRSIYEAANGIDGLDTIRKVKPDVVILDWEMPGLDGTGFMRAMRSPDTFPYPNVPVIMLTGHGARSRVVDAVKVGVNEFLLKPVSVKSLRERLISVLANPRPMVRTGDYYGPMPRKMVEINKDGDEAVASLFMVN
jgi:two-component system chemotaxis response regulator CheY